MTNRFHHEEHDVHTNKRLNKKKRFFKSFLRIYFLPFRPETKTPELLISSCSNRSSLLPSASFFITPTRIKTSRTNCIFGQLFSYGRMSTIRTNQKICYFSLMLCCIIKMYVHFIVYLFEMFHLSIPNDFDA